MSFMTVGKDDARCRNVERQSDHGGDQQDRREGREVQRALDPERNHQDEDGEGDGEGQPHVDHEDRDRQEENAKDRDYADGKTDVTALRRDLRQRQDTLRGGHFCSVSS
ncbi:hypothetical protein D3C71_1010720 [compost metagenome]